MQRILWVIAIPASAVTVFASVTDVVSAALATAAAIAVTAPTVSITAMLIAVTTATQFTWIMGGRRRLRRVTRPTDRCIGDRLMGRRH
ncbi:hypothetical protein AWC26_01000 [Mycobacterium shimoidei]|uniref:Uncharacterized protein n=1 Tax=Mycobacterium shimoidei TaxID=29313 RepID=A0A375Z5K1_MYCSH|nr:hypothetical protein AWC26_01000 [Mycobacterium shimoidei]SSA20665.1 hypothetical protein MSP7336_04697 [Mycobacterium shimoidei]